MSNDNIVVRKRRPYSSVPDDVLEDIRLSMRARLVVAWMLGRPDGWIIRVAMMKVLGTHLDGDPNEIQQVGLLPANAGSGSTLEEFVWEKDHRPARHHPQKLSGMVATTLVQPA
ncbi:MAG: hypothetical protein IPJ73_02150 [Zoogloea sp.]|nr:hypothetical protein [Zoogloea sp.]